MSSERMLQKKRPYVKPSLELFREIPNDGQIKILGLNTWTGCSEDAAHARGCTGEYEC